MIRAVAVVIPANDEAELIARSVEAAAASLAATRIAPERRYLVVVADACRDATASIAAAMGARVIETAHRGVGAARADGIRHVLELVRADSEDHGESTGTDAVWLATTDADSVVPVRWLAEHLAYADAGWDAVVGTVVVDDWSQRPPGLAEVFADHYRTGPWGHPHVHGANLGMSASAYLDAGGFRALACSEDHDLVAAMRARGRRIRRPTDLPVRTSARERSRAPGGFGALLTKLADHERRGGSASGWRAVP